MSWSTPSSAAGAVSDTWVRLVSWRDSPIVAPLNANSMPSVTMNDGRPVVTTTQPLNSPITAANARAAAMPATPASRTARP